MNQPANRFNRYQAVRQLGPGLITGAADDDPSGIATYSQAGAQFGFNMLWTMVITYPLMVGIQLISARIGRVTGRGLAANIRAAFPKPLLLGIVSLLLLANIINIAADIAAMGDAARLLLGGSAHEYTSIIGLLCLTLQVFMAYKRYVEYLKWLTLSLLSYVAIVFMLNVPWEQVAASVVAPKITWDRDTLMIIVAIFGTTISPYLFFWQAAQEVEEIHNTPGAMPLAATEEETPESRKQLRRIKFDTFIGMGFSNLVAFFIILTTAATLHLHGITDIQTSAQAAEALRPLGGEFTFLLFALGIIGTGLLAVPVLAGSAAYAVAECFEWRAGLNLELLEAREFYGLIALATLGGCALDFANISPIKALLWSALLNGIIAVPIMIVMMILASRREVMGRYAISLRLKTFGWLATAVMAAAVIAMFVTT
ncbi:Nramp family divalent metal transporter [Stenotrophobium rhamnosiphilum]|uniref:Iron transporter n=1 Tax=Stenotrophobium rhamnosiphilum TaxID=2029166 RepID=A0A2T5MJM4_9GAMM|nr:Nramp family divalent metal transporter [Stenotrophobium rhamnosiphilum]PTU32749.1 iron transporter [Stenotrophobium rhamnosiphilum]